MIAIQFLIYDKLPVVYPLVLCALYCWQVLYLPFQQSKDLLPILTDIKNYILHYVQPSILEKIYFDRTTFFKKYLNSPRNFKYYQDNEDLMLNLGIKNVLKLFAGN